MYFCVCICVYACVYVCVCVYKCLCVCLRVQFDGVYGGTGAVVADEAGGYGAPQIPIRANACLQ